MRGLFALRAQLLVALSLLATSAWAQTPVVADNGVVNAASFAAEPVSAGSLVSIFGSELASGLAQADSIPLSTQLNNVSVTINGTRAPLLFVSPGQVNAQLPWDLLAGDASTGSAQVVVTRNGVASAAKTFPLRRNSPGVFSSNGLAIAVNNDDGILTQPEGAIPGLTTQPIKLGQVLLIYANGLGPVDKPIAPGSIPGYEAKDLRTNADPVTVLIGTKEVKPLFAGLAPQFAGVNQVNVVVPDDAPTGDKITLQIRSGSATSPANVTIAVRK